MRRFRVHSRNVFSLFMKFGGPQKGGGGVLTPRIPPLDPPLDTNMLVSLKLCRPNASTYASPNAQRDPNVRGLNMVVLGNSDIGAHIRHVDCMLFLSFFPTLLPNARIWAQADEGVQCGRSIFWQIQVEHWKT